MTLVTEAFEGPDKIEFFRILVAQLAQNGHFNLSLSCIARMLLQNLDCNNLICSCNKKK